MKNRLIRIQSRRWPPNPPHVIWRLAIILGLAGLLGVGSFAFGQAKDAKDTQLRVSSNHRFLTHSDGQPFLYLGDTAWELFHRLNRDEADCYLANRASNGFTGIQAVVLAEPGRSKRMREGVTFSLFGFGFVLEQT